MGILRRKTYLKIALWQSLDTSIWMLGPQSFHVGLPHKCDCYGQQIEAVSRIIFLKIR